jgi:hypothetical protein
MRKVQVSTVLSGSASIPKNNHNGSVEKIRKGDIKGDQQPTGRMSERRFRATLLQLKMQEKPNVEKP